MFAKSTFSVLSLLFVSSVYTIPTFLQHTNNEFVLHSKDGKQLVIQRAFIDKELRGISSEKLERFVKAGAVLQLNKMQNSEDYRLRLKGGLNGGGVLGATVGAFFGKAIVSVVGHGTIALIATGVGVFCPPAGYAVGVALESTCGAMIETASMAAAVGCGIAAGAATGPV